jgi:hypothetical protein
MGGALQVLGCIRLSRPLGCIESTNRITDFGLHDYSLTHSLTTTHFLLAAAAVQCTCSGEPSGEGLAFDNYFYINVSFSRTRDFRLELHFRGTCISAVPANQQRARKTADVPQVLSAGCIPSQGTGFHVIIASKDFGRDTFRFERPVASGDLR